MILKYCVFGALALCVACGGEEKKKTGKKAEAPAAGLDKFVMAQDPGPAISVKEAKKSDAEEVIVEGRVQEIVAGFASFKLIDRSLDYCGAGGSEDDKCPTPWDYCCTPQPEIVAATLLVEVRDNSKIVKTLQIPGLRLLDLVVVKGKLIKDEHGNVTILATGWYNRERPKLREGLSWPE